MSSLLRALSAEEIEKGETSELAAVLKEQSLPAKDVTFAALTSARRESRLSAADARFAKGKSIYWSTVDPMGVETYLPDSDLPEPTIGQPIQVVAAKGEYEAASVVIRPLKDYPDFVPVVSGFETKASFMGFGKLKLPASIVDTRIVKVLVQSGGGAKNRHIRVKLPVVLLHDDMRFSFTDAAGRPVRHELVREGDWVRVKALEDAKGANAHFRYGPKRPAILPKVNGFVEVYDDYSKRTYRFPNVNGDRTVICREVSTERDLLYAGGVFYEVPADNAGGFAELRPVALADEPVRSIESRLGLLFINGKPMALDTLWKNGTAAQAYWLWEENRGEAASRRF